jgi:hypothetical protein
MALFTQVTVYMRLIILAWSFASVAQAGSAVFNLPEVPWSPTVISRGQPVEPKYLVSPSLRLEARSPELQKPKPKKISKRDPFFDDQAEFVSIEPMSIAGRVSAPSLPFAIEREKGTRTFHLPRLSPEQALRDSASEVR